MTIEMIFAVTNVIPENTEAFRANLLPSSLPYSMAKEMTIEMIFAVTNVIPENTEAFRANLLPSSLPYSMAKEMTIEIIHNERDTRKH